MGEPEHAAMHNYAYNPSVANWVHSTSLAQLDGVSDEPSEQSPDDYYKAGFPPTAYGSTSNEDTMTTTRQRQQSSNGAIRSTPKPPSVRSVSGPPGSVTSSRPTPQLPVNRPTVRSLAEKFNQPSSTETSPASSRTTRVRSTSRATVELAKPSPNSAIRPPHSTKEAAYGSYKFNNLKPRERPQPAPPSPATVRRQNGVRKSVDAQMSSARRSVVSPTRSQGRPTSSGRQPFFGEVVGLHDQSTPGFGIPSLPVRENESQELAPVQSSLENSTIKLVTEEISESPTTYPSQTPTFSSQALPVRHYRNNSELTATSIASSSHAREPRRHSPPSRIPVPTRRMSVASDSSSSKSQKAISPRPVGGYKRTSPTRRKPIPIRNKEPSETARSQVPVPVPVLAPVTLPATSYRSYRERGKSPQPAVNGGGSLAAVISNPPQPSSPRLRTSRERQLLPHESPRSRSESLGPHAGRESNHSLEGHRPSPDLGMIRIVDQEEVAQKNNLVDESIATHQYTDDLARSGYVESFQAEPQFPGQFPGQTTESATLHQEPLTLLTSSIHAPQLPAPLSATTDFEESPILGMPGSFMMTPPIAQQPQPTPPLGVVLDSQYPFEVQKAPTPQPQGELLQARAFVPPTIIPVVQSTRPDEPDTGISELGFRESIPIMLGSERPGWEESDHRRGHSPRLSIGAHKWRTEPLDASGTIAYLEEDDSPIDPFSNRDSLRPDDSASNVYYRQPVRDSPNWPPPMPNLPSNLLPNLPETSGLTLDSKAYSVINEVLNLYHRSDQITPDVAYESMKKIQKQSPIVAQHKDWGSKESTETYLARLLSDATISEAQGRSGEAEPLPAEFPTPVAKAVSKPPSLNVPELDDDLGEGQSGGTAIIFPSESRRYSRGSHGSTATTIWDDGSRANSSSGNLARDSGATESSFHVHNAQGAHAPQPPPKDWRYSPGIPETPRPAGASARSSIERLGPPGPGGRLLPEITSIGEGLGLSLKQGRQQTLRSIGYAPPRPPYSPPPPPMAASADQPTLAAALYTPSVYAPQPPASLLSSAPLPSAYKMNLSYEHIGPEDLLPPSVCSSSPEATDGAATVVPDEGPVDSVENVEDADSMSLKPAISTASEDPNMVRLRRRYRVMEEIAITEHTFLCDMMVANRMWAATFQVISTDEKEKRVLFCNVEELSKISYIFWDDIRDTIGWVFNQEAPPEEGEVRDPPYDEFIHLTEHRDRKTFVGRVVLKHTAQIERVFNTYLLNHDDANALIVEKAEDPAFLGWQLACYNESKGLTNAWDLDSLLVKPVQRLLKYPLLLDELRKVTPEDHPDYTNIVSAQKELMEISMRINQNKRRKETLRAAAQEGKKEKNKGFRGMGFVKALTNKTTDRVKQPASGAVSEAFNDKEYDKWAQKFGGHFFQIQIVLKDLDKYHDEMTSCFLHLNIVALGFIQVLDSADPSHPELASAWRQKTMSILELRNVLLEDHKKAVRQRVFKPLLELWNLQIRPQKLMEQRKKLLPQYVKYKAAKDRNEKADAKLEDVAKSFIAVNDALKIELPKMYELTQRCVRACLDKMIIFQKDWWKNCQKKLLPLLDYEPEHTTSFPHDMQCYVDRFNSDIASVQTIINRAAICNGALVNDMSNFASPLPIWNADDSSSRKSSSRRTESISSELSTEPRSRRSGGYSHRVAVPSFEGPPRTAAHERSQGLPSNIQAIRPPRESRESHRDSHRERDRDRHTQEERVMSSSLGSPPERSSGRQYFPIMDGTNEETQQQQSAPAMASALLSPTNATTTNPLNAPNTRVSGVFSSALPMPEGDHEATAPDHDHMPSTPTDADEPEVLFLAASLFEFNIAHDRREGGIPYLVYVPGEIFDVIGMKGELWLARNQDDSTKTVGWIWEKHFARILPEEM
ncbi:hypothetical protein B0J11DRAFT_211026 [Dendryphion nanum]|uniref:DH domain-containing protein n=1 Tax=Dendryphion nanum TaxID=256645 RepID=A0A9P9E7B5_9PLEO|nr:hypothetical protein B0J11DRAFT_211026 [Dendryphion nanum]